MIVINKIRELEKDSSQAQEQHDSLPLTKEELQSKIDKLKLTKQGN